MGNTGQGLAVLAEAETLAARTDERYWLSELCRLKGELLLVHGYTLDEVDACFHRAIDIASRQQAKSLELRAAASLSGLLHRQGRIAEARTVLGDIVAHFSDSIDTADLKAARILLASLI